MDIDSQLLQESFDELNNDIEDLDNYSDELVNEFLIIYYQHNRFKKLDGKGKVSMIDGVTKEVRFSSRKELIQDLEYARKEEPQNFKSACNATLDLFKYDILGVKEDETFKRLIEKKLKKIFKKITMKKRPNLLSKVRSNE